MKKEKMCSKKFAKGFTLLELLVVVLIIGILAAIALPQYKKVVLKTQLNSLKEIVESVNSAIFRYYYAHDKFAESYFDLDIELPEGRYWGDNKFYESKNGIRCALDRNQTVCDKNHLRYGTVIFSSYGWNVKKTCVVLRETDPTTLRHKVCQAETKKTGADVYCSNGWCRYYY